MYATKVRYSELYKFIKYVLKFSRKPALGSLFSSFSFAFSISLFFYILTRKWQTFFPLKRALSHHDNSTVIVCWVLSNNPAVPTAVSALYLEPIFGMNSLKSEGERERDRKREKWNPGASLYEIEKVWWSGTRVMFCPLFTLKFLLKLFRKYE